MPRNERSTDLPRTRLHESDFSSVVVLAFSVAAAYVPDMARETTGTALATGTRQAQRAHGTALPVSRAVPATQTGDNPDDI